MTKKHTEVYIPSGEAIDGLLAVLAYRDNNGWNKEATWERIRYMEVAIKSSLVQDMVQADVTLANLRGQL